MVVGCVLRVPSALWALRNAPELWSHMVVLASSSLGRRLAGASIRAGCSYLRRLQQHK